VRVDVGNDSTAWKFSTSVGDGGTKSRPVSRAVFGTARAISGAQIGLVANEEEDPMMKRMLLGIACALCLAAFTGSVARADDKPASTDTTPAKKTHHKKKKAAEGADKAATGTTGTTTK
jgi:hypothetical protein